MKEITLAAWLIIAVCDQVHASAREGSAAEGISADCSLSRTATCGEAVAKVVAQLMGVGSRGFDGLSESSGATSFEGLLERFHAIGIPASYERLTRRDLRGRAGAYVLALTASPWASDERAGEPHFLVAVVSGGELATGSITYIDATLSLHHQRELRDTDVLPFWTGDTLVIGVASPASPLGRIAWSLLLPLGALMSGALVGALVSRYSCKRAVSHTP